MSNTNNYSSNELRKRFRFFLDHAGYRVGYKAQGALTLAKAEIALNQAQSAGLARVRWVDDSAHADLSWLDLPENAGVTVDEVLGCVIEIQCPCCGCWTHVNSLFGICDPGSAYQREIEAELAAESLNALKQALEVAA